MIYTKNKHSRLKPSLILLAALSLLAIIVGTLELTGTINLIHSRKAVSGTIPSYTPKTTTSSGGGSTKPTAVTPAPATTPTTTPTPVPVDTLVSPKTQASDQNSQTATLTAPYGTFVSNHHPNLNGTPAPSQEQSVCQTNPGANCYIRFSSNGVVKVLAVQTADKDGIVIWNWDVNKAGFTEGSWQITAVSTLNSVNKSTTDTLSLEVGP